MTGIELLLRSLWISLIVFTLVLNVTLPWQNRLPALLSDMLTYGKLRQCSSIPRLGPLSSQLRKIFGGVPRRYFTHFYVWGCLWTTLLLTSFILSCSSHNSSFFQLGGLLDILTGAPLRGVCVRGQWTQEELDVLIVLSLFLVQTVRRLYECFYTTSYSNATMHITHYLLGLYFYTALGPTALLHLHKKSPRGESVPSSSLFSLVHWYQVAGVLLFSWASYHQHTCHQILARLRQPHTSHPSQNNPLRSHDHHPRSHDQHIQSCDHDRLPQREQEGQVYRIPFGDWFSYVSSPHYLAEVIIYCAVLLVQCGSDWRCGMWLSAVFVVSELTYSARKNQLWYREKFQDYPRERRIILPLIY